MQACQTAKKAKEHERRPNYQQFLIWLKERRFLRRPMIRPGVWRITADRCFLQRFHRDQSLIGSPCRRSKALRMAEIFDYLIFPANGRALNLVFSKILRTKGRTARLFGLAISRVITFQLLLYAPNASFKSQGSI
jgi:hypothetical protein